MRSKPRKAATPARRAAQARAGGRLIITIDGPGGVGKSTVAKLLAQQLGLRYLDTGATYRALASAALQPPATPMDDRHALARLARRLPLELRPVEGGSLRVLLGGRDITQEIRTERISEAAAQVSQFPAVRQAMVALQRRLANRHSVVVEGRDTGSVVFPRASHKFYLDANPEIRARRRHRELQRSYGMRVRLRYIQEQLQFRDGLDRTRHVGPLVRPEGAAFIDTSHLTTRDVVRRMVRRIAAPQRA